MSHCGQFDIGGLSHGGRGGSSERFRFVLGRGSVSFSVNGRTSVEGPKPLLSLVFEAMMLSLTLARKH